MKRLFLVGIAMVFLVPTAMINCRAEETFSIATAKTVPVIDGKIGEEEWREAVSVHGALDKQGIYEPRVTVFYFTRSADRLYFAVKSEIPPGGRLVSQGKTDGKDVTSDDVWEIWMHPLNQGKDGDKVSYQLMGNSLGFRFFTGWETEGMGWKPVDWKPKWEYKSTVNDRWWMAEISIPLAEVGIPDGKDGVRLKFNLCRSFQNPKVYSSLAGASNFGDPKQMAGLVFDDQAPFVQFDIQENALRLGLVNPSKGVLGVKRVFKTRRPDGREENKEEAVHLATGQKTVQALSQGFGLQEEISVNILLTSEDASKTYFRHNLRFAKWREAVWGEQSKASNLTVFYLPPVNKLDLRYDAASLKAENKELRQVNIVVKEKASSKEILKTSIKRFDKSNEGMLIAELPELKEGVYVVEATPVLASGRLKTETGSFEKKGNFEWEGNRLGLSDDIIPPFKPITVKGKTAGVILRELEMNGFGLWQRIKSQGQKILSDPMTIEAKSDGKTLAWEVDPARITSQKPTEVVYECEARNPLFKLKTRATLEYDGFMKVEMRLIPIGKPSLDRLSLVASLPEGVAYLMHAVNEMCRSCPAGNIPAGQGRVWENRLVPSMSNNKFVPYLWVGGEEKGLCWLADDERDWVINSQKPSMEILREDGKVILRLHFINDPTTLDRERNLVFGLQATPVKPMPEGWRRWGYTWWHNTGMPENYIFFGCTGFYGAETLADPFPRDRDFSIFAGLKKTLETGQIDKETLDKFLKKFPKDDENDQRRRKSLEEVFGVMEKCASSKNNNKGVMLYMDCMHLNSRLPESDCFRGEWRVRPERSLYNDYGVPLYLMNISARSYQDFLLYYYDKLLGTGLVKILYYDEVGFCTFPNYNPAVGKGYINDKGEEVGSRSMLETRTFFKRVAQLYHQRGMYPQIIIHMTNQFIIPYHSFVNMTLDWEDKYDSPDTFLKRFPDDFIRTESIGRQAGTVPLTLGVWNNTTKYSAEKLKRSYWALNLLHGFNNMGIQNQELIDFGCWADDCVFVPCWQKPDGIKVDSDLVKVSYYIRQDSAFVILVNYGPETEYEVVADLKGLKLPASVKATNPETKTDYPSSGGARWKVLIPKHDYRILLVK